MVIIFVAVFLLREWIVQNIPFNADEIALEIERVPEMIREHELVNERPPLRPQHHNQRLDSLFDIHWEENNDEAAPPSPIAEINDPIEENVFQLDNRIIRATSMPPTLSRSNSQDIHYNNNNNRRSASMEPFIDTTFIINEPSSSSVNIHRGHPPHAPRMRHAEAPIPIRPIPEEEEEEEEINPAAAIREEVEEMEEEEEEEENMEEFEGVLEAIGMNGSIWSLLQNSALMGLLIALSLGAAVWMPYLIGMTFIMTETLDLIRIPLKLTRLITDPLIDFLFMICSDYIWPFFVHVVKDHVMEIPLLDPLWKLLQYIKDNGLFFSDTTHTTLSDTLLLQKNDNNTMIDHGIQYVTKLLNDTEPILEHAFQRYQSLATGQTAMDKIACIAVGYMVVVIVSCWYLSRVPNNNNLATAAFGRTAQEAIRHQGIIFKVGMFITIELILFPIVCGFLLDASTLPLFKQATWQGRLEYLTSHPIPSIFLHWFLGTGFMFLFAVLVTICRDMLRPCVMWFIRDPNDPQFHPIREIVERPILFQFKKIGASALIYLTVILIGVGGVVHCIHTFASTILPLRWSLS